jgi:hypothetical protein
MLLNHFAAILAYFVTLSGVMGQNILQVEPNENPELIYQFNSAYIKDNGISYIEIEFSGKKSDDIIRKRPKKEKHFFKRSGELNYTYAFYKMRLGIDSSKTIFLNNPQQKCVITEEKPFYRIQTTALGSTFKPKNISFKLVKQNEFKPELMCNQGTSYSETYFRYTPTQNGEITEELNENGVPFRKAIKTQVGDTTVIEFTYLANRHRKVLKYVVKDGLMQFYSVNDYLNQVFLSRVFEYKGNTLYAEHWFNQNKATHRREYLYDAETKHLKAILVKELDTEHIDIIRYFVQ